MDEAGVSSSWLCPGCPPDIIGPEAEAERKSERVRDKNRFTAEPAPTADRRSMASGDGAVRRSSCVMMKSTTTVAIEDEYGNTCVFKAAWT